MRTLGYDSESFWGYNFHGFKDFDTGQRLGFEFSSRTLEFDRERIKRIILKNTIVTYNGLAYDMPMLWYALQDGVTPDMIKQASDTIIKGRLRWWDVEDALGIRIPWQVKNNFIDLMEPQPNAIASLKSLNGRMHGVQLQDLPYDPDIVPTPEQMDIISDYCLHSDLDATHNLWNALAEPMELRRALGAIHDKNFMSKSDSQIGEAIVKKRVEEITGKSVSRVETKPGFTFRYPVPDWMKFETPALQEFLEQVRATNFILGSNGKVESPPSLNDVRVTLGGMEYSVGIGGLHSTEKNRVVQSDEKFILIDADVASQYPSIIQLMGLYPKSLGSDFLTAYRGIMDERLAAKKRAKEIKDLLSSDPDNSALKRELEQCTVKDKGGKIQLNGVYGKLGSQYSILYAPHLLIAVTLTGQLTLLMLIEQALKAGIDVVSGNTDGLLFRCPRHLYGGLNKDRLLPSVLHDVCAKWEETTTFKLEFQEYKAVYNWSVNTYYALKMKGGHKRKGPIGNPWSSHPDDFDPVRGQLMKNPSMTICSDAVLALITEGTPIEDTIRACRDIRQFVTVVKVSKGATWRGNYLGKTVRFYWGIGGEVILEKEPNASTGNFKKVDKSDGAIECMRLPDEFPSDIDYDRYIAETESILTEIGYYGPKPEPMKRIRITKKNRSVVLRTWMTAA